MTKRTLCGPALLPIFLISAGLTPLNAHAQAPSDAPITANFSNASVRTVLQTLFQNAGIRNFSLDAGVQGTVNVSLSDVPFSLALRQTLAAATPALAFDVLNGVYQVRVKTPSSFSVPSPVVRQETVERTALPEDAPEEGSDRFYKIGVEHYDAGMMADLATRPGGIIVVPPNFVVPANSAASGGPVTPSAPSVTTVGGGTALGPNTPNPFGRAVAALGPQSAPVAANNVLPDGVRRIYARESDNVLVIETAPSGSTSLPL